MSTVCLLLLIANGLVAAPGKARRPASRPSSGRYQSVCRIIAPERDGVAYGSGTLVEVGREHALVVTNWHVVRNSKGNVEAVFPNGFRSRARIVKADRNWDLAALLIRRPNLPAVPLADAVPQLGEPLTIAGYGAGSFRAVTGRCVQYVSPGTRFPAEMLEVSVQARNGDSGGPILNRKGELAGVLFGASPGTTTGSYCGRVRWFLASVSHQFSDPNTSNIAKSSRPEVNDAPRLAKQIHNQRPNAKARPIATGSAGKMAEAAIVPPGQKPAPAIRVISWTDVAGSTAFDQLKTALAAIGALALLAQALRWMS